MKIKAYYSYSDKIKIYLGDAVEIMKSIPDESIDMIFADPPYNLSNDGFTCHAGKRVSVNKGEWDKSKGIEEDYSFHYNWIRECKRILKKNGGIWISGTYHSIYACGYALLSQKWHIINDICWFKPNAAPNLACRMFTASHETLLWAKKDKKAKHTFNYEMVKNNNWDDILKKPGKQMRSVWAITTPKNGEKKYGKHPTQKPEALLERIILATTKENDTVLDPFCGSGTTGVVAVRYNRKFIGIDNEKEYLDKIAIPRLKEEIEKISYSLWDIKHKVAR
ncbi:MAG: site-specific DNA-methyltransferase [Spirochaetota bacterium]